MKKACAGVSGGAVEELGGSGGSAGRQRQGLVGGWVEKVRALLEVTLK